MASHSGVSLKILLPCWTAISLQTSRWCKLPSEKCKRICCGRGLTRHEAARSRRRGKSRAPSGHGDMPQSAPTHEAH